MTPIVALLRHYIQSTSAHYGVKNETLPFKSTFSVQCNVAVQYRSFQIKKKGI